MEVDEMEGTEGDVVEVGNAIAVAEIEEIEAGHANADVREAGRRTDHGAEITKAGMADVEDGTVEGIVTEPITTIEDLTETTTKVLTEGIDALPAARIPGTDLITEIMVGHRNRQPLLHNIDATVVGQVSAMPTKLPNGPVRHPAGQIGRRMRSTLTKKGAGLRRAAIDGMATRSESRDTVTAIKFGD
jgi:hypothetical protein